MSVFAALFGPRIRCESCRRGFRPKLKDDPALGGGVIRRFDCPHCHVRTFVAEISARGVALTAELMATDASDHSKIAYLRGELRREVSRYRG